MTIGISDIFFILVIFQLLFISFFLFTYNKGKKISNILLGSFFLSICLNLIDVFLMMKKVYFSNPSLAGWGNCLPLLFGPLLYLYTQAVLIENFRFNTRKWLHFLPFIMAFLALEFFWLQQPINEQLNILEDILARRLPDSIYLSSSIIFIQFLLYIIVSIQLIRKYKKQVAEKFSDYNRINLNWLYSTIIFFTVLMSISMLNGWLGLTAFAQYYYIAFTVILFAMLIFVNKVVLTAMRNPDFFGLEEEKPEAEGPPVSTKYASSSLVNSEKQRILQVILQYMDNEKPWLEPELTIDQLAADLAIRSKILSQVINETLHQNFFDFINRYRIEEAMRLLNNPPDKKITVLEVLYQVGFNSKSSFNTLFKKHTGLTPSEFKKIHL
ncbi:MAG: helix-turn-helix domain-containing protein [Chitinophagales bacterium]